MPCVCVHVVLLVRDPRCRAPRSTLEQRDRILLFLLSKKSCVRLKERKKEKKINCRKNIYIYIKLDRYGSIYIVESNSQPLEGDGIREESEERGRNERKSERRETFRKG